MGRNVSCMRLIYCNGYECELYEANVQEWGGIRFVLR